MTPLHNPFVIGTYAGSEYFCDRKAETASLVNDIHNGRNIVLAADRRLGKSGLIKHVFAQPEIRRDYYVFYADIYATSSLAEMVAALSRAVVEGMPRSIKWRQRLVDALRSLHASFKWDFLSGGKFSVGMNDITQPELTLDEVFRVLEQADRPCIMAIDEFQQVALYDEHKAEALLRTKIQECRNCHFIFAGSKKHMLSEMFMSPARPFFASTLTMGLAPIPHDIYTAFAQEMFARYGKQADAEAIGDAYRRVDGVTLYVQMVMNAAFELTPAGESCTCDTVQQAFDAVVQRLSLGYTEMMRNLPQRQKALLLAIAQDGLVESPTAGAFVRSHNLVSSSSVQVALKALVDKDIVVREEGSYRIYDRFLTVWLKG